MARLLTILLPVLLLAVPTGAAETYLIDDFEQGLASGWQVKEFAGQTRYQVVADGEGHCLRAESNASASGLVYEVELDPQRWPILRWRWRIEATVPGGDARRKATDDYAARVYVIFPHWFFPRTKTLNYIWANTLPQGEAVPNPFTANAMMIAARSGPGRAGEWVEERHDIRSDFRRLFGGEPPEVGAVAIMTDTDNTGTRATACYDDIRFSGE